MVKLVQVTPEKTNSGTTSFKVSAYIHDYDEGYPPNKYYGQTCVGKMDNYNKKARTITFIGGFLSGQIGKNLSTKGFDISPTVYYEPWR